MLNIKHRSFLIYCILLATQITFSQLKRSPEITKDELFQHVKYLASDALEGRRTGTTGADKAADYIAAEFKFYGLKPIGANNTYYQNFDFIADVELGKRNSFAYSSLDKKESFKFQKDFQPLAFSSSGKYEGEIIFAGYGITTRSKKYDDFASIEVKDKAILVLRGSPEADTANPDFSEYRSIRYKASKAKELGAKALILVTGPFDADNDTLMKFAYDYSYGEAGILVINITQDVSNRLLSASNYNLKNLQADLNAKKISNSFVLNNTTIKIETELKEIKKEARNVLGFIEGNDPILKNEIVVIGAHYDHLGWGGEGSGSLEPDKRAVHHGADDNASGTSGLLEISQYLSSNKKQLKRSLLFIAFTGEELGLLGSENYIKHPTHPIENISVMINMDMIGRLRDKSLTIFGSGTSPLFEPLLNRFNADSTFVLSMNREGFGPSDQSSFYAKKIPVLHFFTGTHPDYHKPSDVADSINASGMESVANFVSKISFALDTLSVRPAYAYVEAPRSTGGRMGIRTSTGVIPDVGARTKGLRITGVRAGGPAAQAGLQSGDVIIKLGRIEITNIYDYMYALNEYKPGDEVDVVVIRGNEIVRYKMIMGKPRM